MGNLLNSYQPEGEWSKTKMIKKYSVQGNVHEISDIKQQMDEAAEWLKNTLASLSESESVLTLHTGLIQLTDDQYVELDNELQSRVSYLLGDNSDWLQDSNLYMEFSKDFRATYNITTFDW